MGDLFTGWMILPNLSGPAEISDCGAPSCARLKILNASARNCSWYRSAKAMRFATPQSICHARDDIGSLVVCVGIGNVGMPGKLARPLPSANYAVDVASCKM